MCVCVCARVCARVFAIHLLSCVLCMHTCARVCDCVFVPVCVHQVDPFVKKLFWYKCPSEGGKVYVPR